MVAVLEHWAASADDAVHGTREPGPDGHHSSRERGSVGGLDQEVDVVRLERKVCDSEIAALAGAGHASLELADDSSGSKDGTPERTRMVTCAGWHAAKFGRGRCGSPARGPVGFRPAPARRPPQRRGSGSASSRSALRVGIAATVLD
jgi:hypothetical protein